MYTEIQLVNEYNTFLTISKDDHGQLSMCHKPTVLRFPHSNLFYIKGNEVRYPLAALHPNEGEAEPGPKEKTALKSLLKEELKFGPAVMDLESDYDEVRVIDFTDDEEKNLSFLRDIILNY